MLFRSTDVLTSPVLDNLTNNFPICGPDWGGTQCGTPGQAPYVSARLTYGAHINFICKFNTSNLLNWSTMFGGGVEGYAAIAVSQINGDIFITGNTKIDYDISTGTGFPIKYLAGALNNYLINGNGITGPADGYIAKFDACCLQIWTTYYGGGSNDGGRSLGTDNYGYFYLAGQTDGGGINLVPPPAGAYYDPTFNGGYDGFILKFNPSLALIYTTYFGGADQDFINSISVHPTNFDIVFVGNTKSDGTTEMFPLKEYDITPASMDYYDPALVGATGGPNPFITSLTVTCPSCREGKPRMISSDEAPVLIYPNPSSGSIIIKSKSNAISKVHINDIMGKAIFSKEKIGVNLYECDLSKLPNGIYVVETTLNRFIHRNKIIISH